MKGLIFNIQRYSLNDGEGIRTIVFFKGCPIACPWCSNPESQNKSIEMIKNRDRCINCLKCEENEKECPTNAYTYIGKWYTLEEVVSEIKKDFLFFQTSGGVTLSGGEVLMQGNFAIALLKEMKRLGIHTAIETCGIGNRKIVTQIAKFCDEILFDLKIMNKEKSKRVLKADIELIKENLKIFNKSSAKVIIRFPLIPNYTDDIENIESILNYMNILQLKEIHILPFHQYGSNKYKHLDKKYILENFSTPSKERVENLRTKIQKKGFKTIIGG